MIYGYTDRPDFAITNTNFFVFINFFTKCKLLHRVGASGSKYGVKRAAFFFAEACVKASTSDYEKEKEILLNTGTPLQNIYIYIKNTVWVYQIEYVMHLGLSV